ncbi:MAG: right-handed parallel beta-helix repeat-containing protein [Verrucomicrobiaceae bacterium]
MKTLFALFFALLPAVGMAAPLSGTKTIGATGDYLTLAAAIADINAQTLGGALVLELQANYTVETLPLVIPSLAGASAANTVTIRPASAVASPIVLTSADTTAATVDLNGAKFVILDGRPGGAGTAKRLTIANSSTSGRAVRFINEASVNTLRHLTLQGVNTSASSGTVVFSTTTGVNGNDDNTISTCDIRDGASTPANGIFSSGSAEPADNSGNTISACNIFNFYRSTAVDAAGVRVESGNNNWTISGNSFYQTASRAGVAATVRAIHLTNTSDNQHLVTGNFIGGTAPGAGGTAWTATGTTQPYVFVGIWLRVGNNTATSVQGNTIRNFAWSSSSNATLQPGVWTGIHVETGAADIGTVTGNIIGSGTGTGSVSITTAGDGGRSFGIGSTSTQLVAISNNTIGSMTVSSTTTGQSASLTGIQVTKGTNIISGNTVGSTSTSNSLNASTTVSSGSVAQQVSGIESLNSGSSNQSTITNNTVANLTNRSTQSLSSARIYGISTTVGVNSITGNTVRNLSTPSQSTSLSVVGIFLTSSQEGQTISRNVIHSLANTSNAAIIPAPNAAVKVAGIYYQGGISGDNVIAGNFVHSLALDSNNTSAELSGVHIASACTFTVQNNMVRVGLDASGASTASAAAVRGLYDNDNGASVPRNFIHNSVYVGGMATSGTTNTFAYSSSSQYNSRDVRNNIFVNARSNNGGTGKHYAMTNGSVVAPPPGLVSDNNIFYVTGAGGFLGRFNGTDCATLAAWQAATGLDASSASTDPRFVNATGTSTVVDMHLQAGNPAEGKGVLIASVTDDFDGQTRGGMTPVDIGADAGNFIYDPAPAISYPLLSGGTTANRVLTGWATIVDENGAVSGGANAPRLYFKKATDADAFGGNTAVDNGWKYVTGTNSGGDSYSFTIDYSIINGGSVTVGETIQYFVVAQDASNNLSSIPAVAAASASPPVQNISARPGTGVNSYLIQSALGSTVTVGPGGSYTSLSGAGGLFAALNASSLTSSLVVNITGNLSEDGSTVLNAVSANEYPNAVTITIQPSSAVMRTISGSGGSGLIRLNGARNVILDGSFGGSGRYLTFRNTNTSGPTILLINDASNNTVRNCVLEGAAVRVVFFSTGVTWGNDNNTVTGNQIRDRSDAAGVPSNLVASTGSSDWVANSGNTISNNEMFNFASSGLGIFTGNASWSITGNTIYQSAPRTTALSGIYFNGNGTNTIRGNIVRDVTTSGTAHGIQLSTQTGSTTVAANRIWNIGNRASSTNFARGIYFQPGAGHGVTVVNNMVVLSSSGTTAQTLRGIYDDGAADSTTTTAYNSVLITGSGGAFRDTWAFTHTGSSNATVKNNVFMNLRTGGSNHFAANRLPSSTGTLTMDYNVYAGTGLSAATDFFDASDASSSAGTPISHGQWLVNVPGDTHSSAGNPGGNFSNAMFVAASSADLHLVPGGNELVFGKGSPVSGVTDDFDGITRSTSTPFIGADELPLTPFQQWALNNNLSVAPGANGGQNLINFAFGLTPTGGSGVITHDGNGLVTQRGTATLLRVANPPGVEYQAVFGRRIGSGLTYTVQFSPDLNAWENNTVQPTVIATDGVVEACTVPIPVSGGQTAKFFRLLISP